MERRVPNPVVTNIFPLFQDILASNSHCQCFFSVRLEVTGKQ